MSDILFIWDFSVEKTVLNLLGDCGMVTEVSYFLFISQTTSELHIQASTSSKGNGITPVCEELSRFDESLTQTSISTLPCICEDVFFACLNLDLVPEFLGKFSTRLKRQVVTGLPYSSVHEFAGRLAKQCSALTRVSSSLIWMGP